MSKIRPSVRKRLLQLMIKGYTRKEAAAKVGIAHSTAKSYVRRVQVRFGYRTVEQMMYEFGRQQRS
jgi:DNA-binding CsgD family transcriptional regulator